MIARMAKTPARLLFKSQLHAGRPRTWANFAHVRPSSTAIRALCVRMRTAADSKHAGKIEDQ